MTERSTAEIRIVPPEEFITLGISRYAFGKSPQKPDLDKARERLKYAGSSIGLAVFDGGKPHASCASHVFSENIRGKVLPMGGLGGVASLPAGRRQGHVRTMLTHSFGLMREQGQVVSALYPFRDSFYERLGYAEFPKNRFVTLKPEQLVPLTRAIRDNHVEQLGIEECFDEWWAFQQQFQAEPTASP